MGYFAVLDTETNWGNEVMSIGIVIAEEGSFKRVDDIYYIFDPEYKIGGMFSIVLPVKGRSSKDVYLSRSNAMNNIKLLLDRYGVKNIYAYNASFDKGLLQELHSYRWFDIMKIAAYKQYNKKIPDNVECCKTGKMKRDYGVEPMMILLSGNATYREKHNALYDSIDELEIMRLLGKNLDEYSVAEI